jgi:hypothetical protein
MLIHRPLKKETKEKSNHLTAHNFEEETFKGNDHTWLLPIYHILYIHRTGSQKYMESSEYKHVLY